MSFLLNPNRFDSLPVPDVYARYTADSFIGTTWYDTSGNGRNGSVSRGTVTKVSTTGNGASKTFNTLQGGTTDGILFPTDVLPATYTLFHISRYNGATRARILNGNGNNWLSGHWGGYSGIAYHVGWLTQYNETQHGSKWVMSSDQNGLYRANMVQRSTSAGGSATTRLGVNSSPDYPEYSDWQCAEIIVYNRTLSASEIVQVETYLDQKYGFGFTGSSLAIPKIGLSSYVDASIAASYPGSGNVWYDLSGNGRNFTWNTTPTYTNSGDLDYFSTSSKVATGPASNSFELTMFSGYTIIYVAATDSFSMNGAFKFYKDGTSSANRGIFAHPTWADSPGTLYFDQNGCCNADQRLTASTSGQTGMRMWALRRNLNGDRSIWRGNSQVASTTTAPSSSVLNGTGAVIHSTDDGYNWNGRIVSFIVYNRGISDAEISSIYSYFNSRGLANA